MRSNLLASVALLITSLPCALPADEIDIEDRDPSCLEDVVCEGPPCRKTYVQADILFLNYGRGASSQPVVIRTIDDNFNYPGPTLLSSGDAGLGTQYGPQITFGVLNEDCRGWELTYFGLFGGGGSATALGDNDLAIPGVLGLASYDFFASNQMTVTTSGELHSFEVNRIRRICDWTVLGGFRYFRLEDALNIRAGDPDTSGSDYHIDAVNNLFGVQAGLRRSGQINCLGWDVSGKAGLFGNSATQNQFVTDFPNPNPPYYLRDPLHSSASNVAFVGELNLGVSYQLTERLAARAGYKLLWVEGVALAANQLDFDYPGSTSASVANGGGVFLHGAFAGLEASW